MLDLSTTVGTVALGLIVLAFFLPTYIKLLGYTKKRLMRCPETGAITLVEVTRIPTGEKLGLGVKSCELWPEKKECRRGCLSRRAEPRENSRFDLHSLRPFTDYEVK
jgi:hypothetical protein